MQSLNCVWNKQPACPNSMEHVHRIKNKWNEREEFKPWPG